MLFGIDRLLAEPDLRTPLKGRRVALLAHPASVTADLVHSLDALAALDDIQLTAAFGPQHGLRGDKQDNMVESPDFTDPVHGIPPFCSFDCHGVTIMIYCAAVGRAQPVRPLGLRGWA